MWISDTSGNFQPGQFITNGTSSATIAQTQPIGDMLTLMKTGSGEFVLSGANAQKLLMEYFEQAPEMWLRLMALKAEEEENG